VRRTGIERKQKPKRQRRGGPQKQRGKKVADGQVTGPQQPGDPARKAL
jgi:hypothetical protein